MNISNLFSGGRIGRLNYFLGNLALCGALLVVAIVAGIAGNVSDILGMLFGLVYFVAAVAALVVSISLGVRRFHDMDKEGWYVVFQIIPLVNLVALVFLLFVKGTEGPNRFGPKPAADVKFMDAVLNTPVAGSSAAPVQAQQPVTSTTPADTQDPAATA